MPPAPAPPAYGTTPSCGAPSYAPPGYAPPGQAPAAAAPAGKSGSKILIFVVVGAGCALVGIALIGILAALIIPNFLDAMQKAKQKRTVADMRAMSTSLEEYNSNQETYPNATDASQLKAVLAGNGYTGPVEDGWKHPLRYTCLAPAEARCASYELDSPGKDGVFEHAPGEYEEGVFETNQFDSDIVVKDGTFLRYPGRVEPH
jgi:type II secretory pathway pseudopilin PulG